jgi:phenylpropionate dioxygenase-like ring-hydroxylating dioxygenase large terminal subunit
MPQVERFPHPIPYGWYFVAFCDELAAGDVQPLHYFGRDLVLFRDADGKAGLLDAHCPHLGAHLGYGGKVEGSLLRCPFHGWGYDVDGWCRNVPYAKVQPPVCKREPLIHAYPLTEANGVIWAWYHPQNAAPLFDVEVYPEFTEPGWARQIRYAWRVAINPQEVAENGVDVAHFQFVHGLPAVPEGESRYHAQVRQTRADGWREVELPDGSTKRIQTSIETIMNGAGQKITRFTSETQTSLMVLVTPIEADDAWIRYAFTHTEVPAGSAEEKALQEACWRIGPGPTGITPDLPIWQHKIHVSRPILCDGDGHILRFRQYFAQFYADDGEPQKVAAE